MSLTKEQWKDIEKQLDAHYGIVRLKIDGYKVMLEVRQIAPLKLVIVPFVNGWSKGEWLVNDCEERRRFMRPVIRPLYTATEKERICGHIKKRDIVRFFPNIDKKFIYHHMTCPSFKPLMRHLIKNNQSIELDEEPFTL